MRRRSSSRCSRKLILERESASSSADSKSSSAASARHRLGHRGGRRRRRLVGAFGLGSFSAIVVERRIAVGVAGVVVVFGRPVVVLSRRGRGRRCGRGLGQGGTAVLGLNLLVERVAQLVRGAFELRQALAEGPSELGQLPRAEHDERDDKNDDQFRYTQRTHPRAPYIVRDSPSIP
jgi:hypothetical protein